MTEIEELLRDGRPYKAIAAKLGIGFSAISYHAKRLGLRRGCQGTTYPWGEIQRYYNEGNSVRACMKKFGFTMASWGKASLRGEVTARPAKLPIATYLVRGTQKLAGSVKKRLFSEGMLTKICAVCGLGSSWNNKHLTLHVDHINGDPKDNRRTNLRVICPNCHQQTPTWGHKERL